jgi:hypothetical protein
MRTLAGCRSCGNVEMTRIEAAAGEDVGRCRLCGSRMRAVGLLGASLLSQAARERIPRESAGHPVAGREEGEARQLRRASLDAARAALTSRRASGDGG